MKLRRTALSCCLLAVALLSGQTKSAAVPVPVDAGTSCRQIIAHTYYPEARLRKVHLVRPDLIFYPLDYEIFC